MLLRAGAGLSKECGPPMTDPVRILVADDHLAVRDALRRSLELEPGFEIVGEAADGQQAVALAEQLQPDVILMDSSMPDVDGVDATRQIAANFPRVRIIALSLYTDPEKMQAMLDAGAASYVDKSAGLEALVNAIRGKPR